MRVPHRLHRRPKSDPKSRAPPERGWGPGGPRLFSAEPLELPGRGQQRTRGWRLRAGRRDPHTHIKARIGPVSQPGLRAGPGQASAAGGLG